jgi:hypothetical protein
LTNLHGPDSLPVKSEQYMAKGGSISTQTLIKCQTHIKKPPEGDSAISKPWKPDSELTLPEYKYECNKLRGKLRKKVKMSSNVC